MSSSSVTLRLATEPVVCVKLEQIAREGARRALQKAIEDEVADYLNAHRNCLDDAGHRLVVRNGHKPARTILSGLGPIESKVFPSTRQQRCWVHKTANVLDKLPKSQHQVAKENLHEIWMSATKEEAIKALDRFVETYGVKWPRAAECLEKDRAELLAFYDFPAEHWGHLRTTNPIESTFATVRLRTYRAKGPGSRAAGLAMAFKLAQKAEKGWRRLNKSEKLQEVIDGIVFVDGIKKAA